MRKVVTAHHATFRKLTNGKSSQLFYLINDYSYSNSNISNHKSKEKLLKTRKKGKGIITYHFKANYSNRIKFGR